MAFLLGLFSCGRRKESTGKDLDKQIGSLSQMLKERIVLQRSYLTILRYLTTAKEVLASKRAERDKISNEFKLFYGFYAENNDIDMGTNAPLVFKQTQETLIDMDNTLREYEENVASLESRLARFHAERDHLEGLITDLKERIGPAAEGVLPADGPLLEEEIDLGDDPTAPTTAYNEEYEDAEGDDEGDDEGDGEERQRPEKPERPERHTVEPEPPLPSAPAIEPPPASSAGPSPSSSPIVQRPPHSSPPVAVSTTAEITSVVRQPPSVVVPSSPPPTQLDEPSQASISSVPPPPHS
ncbi:hypothetical protein PAPYR_2849 [Paratrimastix pyriformis]|uniref:Uncharacterized protein n=1 Tax=Paratrimastix pyriformis TaxID=342808 RepID=A0ABQ8UQ77_9EUKA|nr:hypothetical protein PAPYR_2849 [Paratrimastix pyriformis]